MKKPISPVMTHDTDILEAMTSLSMFKKLLMIRDCEDPKKLKRHIKYWSTKVENLTNYPLKNSHKLDWIMPKTSWKAGVISQGSPHLVPRWRLSILALSCETGKARTVEVTIGISIIHIQLFPIQDGSVGSYFVHPPLSLRMLRRKPAVGFLVWFVVDESCYTSDQSTV